MVIKKYEDLIAEKKDFYPISAFRKKTYKEFVAPNQECIPNEAFGTSFCLDDTEFYDELFKKAKTEIKDNWNVLTVIYNFLHTAISNYFGIDMIQGKREQINNQNDDKHSIKEYKGKDAGVCFERSIMAHNIMLMLGYNSMLVFKDSHAYILVESRKGVVLYDPANPTIATIKGKKYCLASFLPISKETAKDFIYGDKQVKLQDTPVYKLMFPDEAVENFDIPDMKYNGLKLPKTEEKLFGDLEL